MAKVNYLFQGFKLACDTLKGDAYTIYPDGAISQRGLVSDDNIHAKALGITPQQAAIVHELAHHLVGSFFYRNIKHYNRPKASCAITYHDAHGWDMPVLADTCEWWITSFIYFSYAKLMPQAQDWGALIDMQDAGFDAFREAEKLRKLMQYQPVPGIEIERL